MRGGGIFWVAFFFFLEKMSCYYIRNNKSISGLYTSLPFPTAFSGVFSSSQASGNSALYELQQTLHSVLCPLENSVRHTFAFPPLLLSDPFSALSAWAAVSQRPPAPFPSSYSLFNSLLQAHSIITKVKNSLFPIYQSSPPLKNKQTNHHKFILRWELWNWKRFRLLLFIQAVMIVLQKKSQVELNVQFQ